MNVIGTALIVVVALAITVVPPLLAGATVFPWAIGGAFAFFFVVEVVAFVVLAALRRGSSSMRLLLLHAAGLDALQFLCAVLPPVFSAHVPETRLVVVGISVVYVLDLAFTLWLRRRRRAPGQPAGYGGRPVIAFQLLFLFGGLVILICSGHALFPTLVTGNIYAPAALVGPVIWFFSGVFILIPGSFWNHYWSLFTTPGPPPDRDDDADPYAMPDVAAMLHGDSDAPSPTTGPDRPSD